MNTPHLGLKVSSDTSQVNFVIGNANTSTSGQIIDTIGSALKLGVFAYAAAMKGGSSAASQQTQQTQQTQQSAQPKGVTITPEQKVQLELSKTDAKLEGLKEQLQNANSEVTRLTKATNENDIKAKEIEVNKLKDELYTKDGAYQENVSKVIACEQKVTTATSTLENATNTYNSISGEIASLKQTKAGQDALVEAGGPNAEKAKNYSERLKEQIDQKEIIQAQAKKDMEKAGKALVDATKEKTDLQEKMPKYQEIQNTKVAYDNQNAELTSLKNGLAANQGALKKLTESVIPGLKQQVLELEKHSQSLNDQLLEFSANEVLAQKEINQNVSNSAKKYNDANNKDGNWWKRNMPTWLGGSNKANKAQYKTNHEAKKTYATELKNDYGVDVKDYLKNNRTNNTLNYVQKNKCMGLYNYIDKLYKKNSQIKETEIADNLKSYADKIMKENPRNKEAALKKAGFSKDQIDSLVKEHDQEYVNT